MLWLRLGSKEKANIKTIKEKEDNGKDCDNGRDYVEIVHTE